MEFHAETFICSEDIVPAVPCPCPRDTRFLSRYPVPVTANRDLCPTVPSRGRQWGWDKPLMKTEKCASQAFGWWWLEHRFNLYRLFLPAVLTNNDFLYSSYFLLYSSRFASFVKTHWESGGGSAFIKRLLSVAANVTDWPDCCTSCWRCFRQRVLRNSWIFQFIAEQTHWSYLRSFCYIQLLRKL